MRYQHSIEEAAQDVWRSKFGNASGPVSRAVTAKAPSAIRERMLREDSAFAMHPGYRDAIKRVRERNRAEYFSQRCRVREGRSLKGSETVS